MSDDVKTCKRYAVKISHEGEIIVCEEQPNCPKDAQDPYMYPGVGTLPQWINLWAVDEERACFWALTLWQLLALRVRTGEARK